MPPLLVIPTPPDSKTTFTVQHLCKYKTKLQSPPSPSTPQYLGDHFYGIDSATPPDFALRIILGHMNSVAIYRNQIRQFEKPQY